MTLVPAPKPGFTPKPVLVGFILNKLAIAHYLSPSGERGGVVVKALPYKPAGRIPDGVNGIFQ